MKRFILILLLDLMALTFNGQDLINPYLDYDNVNTFLPFPGNQGGQFNNSNITGPYNGEFEILLDRFPWGNPGFIDGPLSNPLFDLNNFDLTYQVELVSFPFSADCMFPSDLDPSGGCTGMSERIFNVPPDSYIVSPQFWEYPPLTSGPSTKTHKLWNQTPLKPFDRQPNAHTISDPLNNNALVSIAFGSDAGATVNHTILPHSILKIKINLHCGSSQSSNSQIINSFSFYVDLTRARLREYPFRSNNSTGLNIADHDLLIRPQLVANNSGFYIHNDISNCVISRFLQGGKCEDGITVDNLEGININYTPFDPASDDNCQFITTSAQNAEYGDSYYNNSFTGDLSGLPLADYSLIASTSVRNFYGTTLAGYNNFTGQSTMQKLPVTPIVHEYRIDKNIDLNIINNSEKIIFNPSEASIFASDLRFPSHYSFKTIRGTYPFSSEVIAAKNDPMNGGPFTDPTNIDVPVATDLYKDFHIANTAYSATDHKFASIYHLMSGSRLTLEPCVKIFDATFELNPGSEMVFENWSTNQVNVNRYQLLYSGGTVTKRNNNFLFQNEHELKKILNFESDDYILAGENVNSSIPTGDYIIDPNAEVNFAAHNYIEIKPGFTASNQSTFSATIKPVSVPACPPMRIRNSNEPDSHSINALDKIEYFTFSPNPAQEFGYFMFKLNVSSSVRIKVFDIIGNLILEIERNQTLPIGRYTYNLDSSSLSSGMYIAQLESLSESKTLKFIKQ